MVFFKTSFVGAAALAAGFVNAAPQYGYAGGDASSSAAYGGSYTTSSAMADMSMSTSSAMMDDSSSSSAYVYSSSSAMMDDSTSTSSAYNSYSTSSAMMDDSTSTSSAYNSYSTSSMASYGSGSMSWGSSGYNDCVQQCVAQFGAPMATYTPTATSGSDSSSSGTSSGSGSTITVIVAPTQGVLRYVPFAVNASVGDTVEFVWHANMHTVTHSSELEVCNKTLDDPFTSGVQNESFTFSQVVNSTDPTFFYCGVPTHCQKGMFGIINPPSAIVSNMSVGSMMPTLVSNDSTTSMMNSYMQSVGQGSSAENWGSSIDMSNMPPAAYSLIAQNVLYTRTFLAANPDYMQADGSVNLGASSSPMMIPQDLSAVPQNASAASSTLSVPAASGSAASSGSSPAGTAAAASSNSSGARGIAASSAVAAIVAFGSAFLLL